MLDGYAVCAWRRPSLMSCYARHGRGRRGTLSLARYTRRVDEPQTAGFLSSFQGRSRQASCHPVRAWAVTAPTTKCGPPRLDVRACVGTSQDGPHFVVGLVPEQKAPGQGVAVIQRSGAVSLMAEALPGSGAPAQDARAGKAPMRCAPGTTLRQPPSRAATQPTHPSCNIARRRAREGYPSWSFSAMT
jgi:hypothetical protein